MLGIRPGEERSASLMLAHSFFMGSATVFFETAASALFLARFGAEVLPWVYVVAAAVTTVTGVAYAEVKRRVSFGALMAGTLVFLLVSALAFRLGLGLTSAAWLVFGGLAWYRAISILTDLEYWAVATRLYDVRQAKRLFGLIGTGEVVARIAGAFSVPFLVPRIGVENLVLASGAGLAGCLVLLMPILRLAGRAGSAPGRDYDPRARGSLQAFRELSRSRYTRLVFLVAAMAVLGKYFVDFAFLEQMKSRYQDAPKLAGFFGIFSGTTQALSLLTRLFLSGRLLSRFGIRVGLVVLPLAHVACTALLLSAGFAPWPMLWIFWLSVANQGIYKTIKHPIDNPSFKVLYQPLRAADRLSAQIAVEAIVGPIAMGAAGFVMLLFSGMIPYEPILFAGAMLLTFGAWLAGATILRGEYKAALTRALEKRIVDGTSLELYDEPSLAILRGRLGSGDPGDVVFAMDLLERIGDPGHARALLDLLEHPAPEVRRYALLRIEALRLPSALGPVDRRLDVEESPWVRAAAMRALCALGGAAAIDRVAPFLDHAEPQIRRGALVGLLRAGGPEGRARAAARLLRLVESRKAPDRELAAQAIAEAGDAVPPEAVRRLLQDPSREVRRAALLSAGRLGEPSTFPALVAALADPALQAAAGTALAAAGEAAIPSLRSAFEGAAGRPARRRIAAVLGRIRGASAQELLWEQVGVADESVRSQVLEALARCGFRATEARATRVQDGVMAEARAVASKLALLVDLGDDSELLLVQSALKQEVGEGRDRMLLLLSLVYDAKSLLSARANLSHALRERRAYAVEILDVTLPRWLCTTLMPLFDEMSPEDRLARLQAQFPQPRRGRVEALREVLERPDGAMRPWTRACAIEACARCGLDPGLDVARLEGEELVKEAAGLLTASRQGTNGRSGMKTIEKVILLKRAEMFARTPEEVLAEVAQLLEEEEYAAGQRIFEKGEAGDSLYIVVDGSVRVFDGELTLNRLGAGDIFGELALLDPEPRSASVEAAEDTRLLRLDRDTFSELMAGNIDMVTGVLRVLCQRLRRLSAAVAERSPSQGPA